MFIPQCHMVDPALLFMWPPPGSLPEIAPTATSGSFSYGCSCRCPSPPPDSECLEGRACVLPSSGPQADQFTNTISLNLTVLHEVRSVTQFYIDSEKSNLLPKVTLLVSGESWSDSVSVFPRALTFPEPNPNCCCLGGRGDRGRNCLTCPSQLWLGQRHWLASCSQHPDER